MRTIERNSKRIIIEVTKSEVTQKGFDLLWDEIREIYPDNLYDIDSVSNEDNEKIIIIKLKIRKKH